LHHLDFRSYHGVYSKKSKLITDQFLACLHCTNTAVIDNLLYDCIPSLENSFNL